jgi:hypothetical protein
MKILKLLTVVTLLLFLVSCASSYVKFGKKEIEASWNTDPEKIEALSKGKERSTIANFGESVNNLVRNFTYYPGNYSGQEIVIVGLAEIYEKISKPGEKVSKRTYNNNHSITGEVAKSRSSNNNDDTPLIEMVDGFTYKDGWYFWNAHDPDQKKKFPLSIAKKIKDRLNKKEHIDYIKGMRKSVLAEYPG